MLEILTNGQIMLVDAIGDAIVKTPYLSGTMEKKIKAKIPKTSLTLNEPISITFTWHKFNLDAQDWLPDPENTEPIRLDIDGEKLELQPENGTDVLTFSSAEPGLVTIKTENPGVDNAALEVTVNA